MGILGRNEYNNCGKGLSGKEISGLGLAVPSTVDAYKPLQ
jgi:hypothetical protein